MEKHGYYKTNFLTLLTLGWYGVFAYARMIKDVNFMSDSVFGRGEYVDIKFTKAVGFLICPFVGFLYILLGSIALSELGIIPRTVALSQYFFEVSAFPVGVLGLGMIALMGLLYVSWAKGRAITARLADIVKELGSDRLGYNTYNYLECLGRSTKEKERFELFNELTGYFDSPNVWS